MANKFKEEAQNQTVSLLKDTYLQQMKSLIGTSTYEKVQKVDNIALKLTKEDIRDFSKDQIDECLKCFDLSMDDAIQTAPKV